MPIEKCEGDRPGAPRGAAALEWAGSGYPRNG